MQHGYFLLWVVSLMASTVCIDLAIPSKIQKSFMETEMTMFLHFSLATWGQIEHNCCENCNGDGGPCLPPKLFNPNNLNTDQWIQTAVNMGAKEACLTAHHEGGFCLWPSKFTNYSISYSPYKNGKGDVVKDFVNSCNKYGIKTCYYLSANSNGYDFHNGISKEEFLARELGMLTEVLTNYGPIDRLWFDHYWDPCATLSMCPGGFPEYWRIVSQHVRTVSPTTIMAPGMDGFYSNGGESGSGMYPLWNPANTVDGSPYSSLTTNGPYGSYFRSREADYTIQNPGDRWFWKVGNNHGNYSSGEVLFQHYLATVGRGQNFILNVPPDTTGQIPEAYVNETAKLGHYIKALYAQPLVSIINVEHQCSSNNFLELFLSSPHLLNTTAIISMEDMKKGQRILNYVFDALVDGEWMSLFPLNGGTIGHKVIDLITNPVRSSKIRFRCLSIMDPVYIKSIVVYQQ